MKSRTHSLFGLRLSSLLTLTALICLTSHAVMAQPVKSTASSKAPAAAIPAQAQAIADEVEQYLIETVSQLHEGEPKITVIPPTSLQNLEGCSQYQVFLPPGRKLRSDTTVGVRCATTESGTTYVRASVAVEGTHYVAAQTLSANQAITADLLEARTGDLMRLAPHAQVGPAQLFGRVTTQRVLVGKPVRLSATRSANSVQRGDTVRVEVKAPGMSVTNQGEALSTADVGGSVQIRMQNGKTIQGVVSESGVVFVTF